MSDENTQADADLPIEESEDETMTEQTEIETEGDDSSDNTGEPSGTS